MAIDFSQVKSLTIPEGEVTKITDSSGNVLWKKAPSWHTIWEGNVTSHNSTSEIEVAHLDALSGTVTLRVTWSCTASGGYDHNVITEYYNNSDDWSTTTIKPANPFQFDLDTASDRHMIVGCTRLEKKYSRFGRMCYLRWRYASKTFRLQGGVGSYGDGDVDLSMTITKIEQYS